MAQEKMYKAALEAIDQGQTARARDLFTRLLRSDSSKAEYWLWMSTLVETNQERVYCLESALRVDPDNEAARRGLVILGAREADKDVKPVPVVRRNWEKDLELVAEPSKSVFRRVWDNRALRFGSFILAGMIVIGLIFGAIYGGVKRPPEEPLVVYKVSPFPTRTPEPTLTPSATRTLAVRTPTPVITEATPIWLIVPQTNTPAPLYINTPHPAVEAYRAGIRAYEEADWAAVLTFMEQANTIEPDSPDILYYIAEAYRMMGENQDAVRAYERALDVNPEFAPAYLGRALAYEKIDPQANIEGELNYAIKYDPNYVDAYLNRARVRVNNNNPNGALDDLLQVDKLVANQPMMYILLAQAYLELNDTNSALQAAQIGFELDKTSLVAYLTLAKVYLAMNHSQQALQYIDQYLAYSSSDAQGWAIKAQAAFQLGNFPLALEACNQGILADSANAQSWYYCGIIHLDQGDARTAVNELVSAVNADPKNFNYNISLGKALWNDDRLDQAVLQFTGTELISTTDRQLAEVYYNRARVYEQLDKQTKALEDWEQLLALPQDQVPSYWRTYAEDRVAFINRSTPTPGSTATRTPRVTAVPSSTPTANRTPIPPEPPSG
jgi:tetratricopeptide (TPR) repeat protein